MIMKTNIKHSITFIGLLVLFVALALIVTPAKAGLRWCVPDPMVLFSDGSKVTISLTIQTEFDNLNSIQYYLHVPANTPDVTKIVYTPGYAKGLENLQVIYDAPAGVYTVDTLVMSDVDAPVSAAQVTKDKNGLKIYEAFGYGFTNVWFSF